MTPDSEVGRGLSKGALASYAMHSLTHLCGSLQVKMDLLATEGPSDEEGLVAH